MNNLFSHLQINDNELRKSLNECTEYSQAFEILKKLETDLNLQLADLENHTDAQKLLDELHRYNDIKDMTQILIGSLAIIRGVTAAELHHLESHDFSHCNPYFLESMNVSKFNFPKNVVVVELYSDSLEGSLALPLPQNLSQIVIDLYMCEVGTKI